MQPADHVLKGLLLGHVLFAVGPGVSGVEIGERVAVRWLYSVCQECELCQTGFENLCNKRKLCGKDVNGCFAEYAVTNANYLIKLPDGVSDIDVGISSASSPTDFG